MKTHTTIVAASIAALLAATGIDKLSPEAREMTDRVGEWAEVKDRYLILAGEISGRDYFEGINSPLDADSIARLTEAMRAEGILDDPGVIEAVNP